MNMANVVRNLPQLSRQKPHKEVTSRRLHNNRAIDYSIGTKTLLLGCVQNQDRGRRD